MEFRSDLFVGMLVLFLTFRNLQRVVNDLEDPGDDAQGYQRYRAEAQSAEQELPNEQRQVDVAVELIALSLHVELLFQSFLHCIY